MSAAIRGFVISVIATAVSATAVALLLVTLLEGMPRFNAFTLWLTFQILLTFGAVAAGSMIILGFPLTYILSRYRAERDWTYPVVGAMVGAVVAFIFLGVGPLFAPGALAGAVFGGIAGSVWWITYRKGCAEQRLSSATQGSTR